MSNSTELSYLIAQVHRSIAKTEKKKEQADNGISTLLLDKGVSDGPNITTDWWNRQVDFYPDCLFVYMSNL